MHRVGITDEHYVIAAGETNSGHSLDHGGLERQPGAEEHVPDTIAHGNGVLHGNMGQRRAHRANAVDESVKLYRRSEALLNTMESTDHSADIGGDRLPPLNEHNDALVGGMPHAWVTRVTRRHRSEEVFRVDAEGERLTRIPSSALDDRVEIL